MRRTLPLGLAAGLALALAAPVAAQEGVDRIDLPDGWQPEGITTDGESLYVGSLADGAVWKADPITGSGDVLVPGRKDSVAVGMDIGADGRLWVAGGRTGKIRAFDLATGERVANYTVEGGFLNDVAVTPEAVYVTDSFEPQVVVIPLGDDGTPPPKDAATSLPISGELVYGEGFNINGIVALPAGLVVVHSGTGELFRIDPTSGDSVRIDTGDADLTTGDGIEPDGSVIHVMRNRANTVASLELDADATTATLIGETTSPDFDVPATTALVGEDLWAANARFGTAGDGDDAYWLTRVDVTRGRDE